MLKEVTDFMKIDINKVTVSDSIPCYNGKNSRYVLRYLTNERAIRRLFIRLTSTVLTIAMYKGGFTIKICPTKENTKSS